MSERRVWLLVALLLGGMAWLFADGSRSLYLEASRFSDHAQWVQSQGVLRSMEVTLASSGRNTGYVVTCGYTYPFSGATATGDTCDLGSVVLLGEAAAKARAEAIAGVTGRATWRAFRQGRLEGWVLDMGELPVAVRHSTRHAAASTLTATEPSPAWLYWVGIAVTSALGLVTGLACLFCVLAAWGAGDWSEDAHWRELLFRDHPKRELVAWARSMHLFRFVRGSGGGMDDHGDRLAVALRAGDDRDVEHIFAALGVAQRPLPLPPEANGSGYLAFEPAASGDMPGASQPAGLVTIAGIPVTAYRAPGRVELSITDADRPAEVTQAAVDSARELEGLLSLLASRVIDPPQDDKHCISPVFYPSFWEDKPAADGARPTLDEIESAAQGRRDRGLLMMWVGAALVLVAVATWQGLGWPLPGAPATATAAPADGVVGILYGAGGAGLAVGAFLLPGIALLLGARREARAAKRVARRMRRKR